MSPLVRASHVAALLDVRPSTVYEMARRGLLPHIRICQGSRRALIRFRREDIEQLIRERSVGKQDHN